MNALKIESLYSENFRNLSSVTVNFNQGINCIFGDNGNGKTNLLELIYYLCSKKSFRKNTSFQQIISVDSENSELIFSSVFIDQENKKIPISAKVNLKESIWYKENTIDNKKVKIPVVFINPFDSYSFHTTPSFRRAWIDKNLSMISADYKSILNKYNNVLKQRNFLLQKKPSQFLNQIIALDEQLTEFAYKLTIYRTDFVDQLSSYIKNAFKLIFDQTHELNITLDSKFENFSLNQIKEYYKENLSRDCDSYMTQYGVHKDDYVFHFDGFNSYEFCSLGQQKMSYLSLIFAYIELFRYKFISYPIVLIDDVSGELDSRRWQNLIQYLKAKKFQVFITTANENFKNELEKIDNSKKIYVEEGFIKTR